MRRLLYWLILICAVQVGSGVSALAQSPTIGCPKIIIYGPSEPVGSSTPVSFFVSVQGADPKLVQTYDWSLSAGTIINGFGTPDILVDTSKTGGESVTVTVKVDGLGPACENIASYTMMFGCKLNMSRQFDEYGDLSFKNEMARLDNFAIQLDNQPGSQGYIIVYNGHNGEAQMRADRAKAYLVSTLAVDPALIVTVDGGFREHLQIELWIVPKDADPPTPRLDDSNDKGRTVKDAVP